jgi:hypothetical protein
VRDERGLPGAIVHQTDEIALVAGRPAVAANILMTDEQFAEYKEGRRCLKCHGKQDVAMPEVCQARDVGGAWVCGYRIRADQLRHLESEYRGEHFVGETPDDTDYEREFWKPAGDSRIWVPGSAKE